MDNLQLQEEVQALRKFREHYEELLRLVGFELCDLPDEVSALLDECAELQTATNLHDLEDNYLKEFYFVKKKEQVDNSFTLAKLQSEIKEQVERLQKEAAECATLEKFTTDVNKRLISDAEMQRHKIMLETKMQGLQQRQEALNESDFKLDDLIRKIDLLKQSKAKEK